MEQIDCSETLWARGRSDAKSMVLSFWGMVLEAGGATVVGAKLEPVWGIVWFVSVICAIWSFATMRAPIRQRNEAREALVKSREEIESLEDDKPNLTVIIKNVFGGATTPEQEIIFGLGSVTITNLGQRPSAFEVHSLKIINGDKELPFKISRHASFFVMLDGLQTEFKHEESLYRRSDVVIKEGGRAKGHIVGTLAIEEAIKDPVVTAEITISDIYGRLTTSHKSIELNIDR